MFSLTTILWQLGLQLFRHLKQSEVRNKLKKLQDTVEKGDLKKTKAIVDWFHQNLERIIQILTELYSSDVKCTTQTDIILAACQSGNVDMLVFILFETDILEHLSDDSLDDTEANKQKTEVFRHVLRPEKFRMLELLYIYWCGDWFYKQPNIQVFEMFENALKDADQELKANLQDIIMLNAFNRDAYTEYTKLKPSDITPKGTAAMILRVLRVYHKYSHLLLHPDTSKPKINADVKVNISRLRNLEKHEVVFFLMDGSISKIILENLNILRKHLKKRFNKTEKYFKDNPNLEIFYKRGAESYKEIESEIYHFAYREKLQLVEKEPVQLLKFNFDMRYTVECGLVRRLRQNNFRRNLKKLAKLLRIHVICRDPAENRIGTQSQSKDTDKTRVVPLLDENYLQAIKYMRDNYSLRSVMKCIGVIENAKDVNVLMIERVLHVIGEMLKSTDDSYHLSRPTLALLQVFIPMETIRHLNKIRDFFSKANNRHLSIRIDMANTQPQTLFNKIKEELIEMKSRMLFVTGFIWIILSKSMLKESNDLLNRQNEHVLGLRQPGEDFFCDELTDYSCRVVHTQKEIFLNIMNLHEKLILKFSCLLPTIVSRIRLILKCILSNNDKVNTINNQLYNYDKRAKMRDFPDVEEINRIQNKAARLMKLNNQVQIDMDLLNEIRNYTQDWNWIKNIINFCLIECELFPAIRNLHLNEDSLPDTPTVEKVHKILAEMEQFLMQNSTFIIYDISYDFDGIEKLIGDFTAAKTIKLGDPRVERGELISCLIKRLDLLKQTLLYPQRICIYHRVLRFIHNEKCRLILEMIMADIANVLAVCNIRLMNKSSRLLKEIDLGNVLDHGNPFLDFIYYDVDFATELLDKAMMFAEDGEAIEALYELYKGNVEYDTIKAGDHLKMDVRQQQLYEKFKKSPNWESYVKLTRLPIFKPKTGKKN